MSLQQQMYFAIEQSANLMDADKPLKAAIKTKMTLLLCESSWVRKHSCLQLSVLPASTEAERAFSAAGRAGPLYTVVHSRLADSSLSSQLFSAFLLL